MSNTDVRNDSDETSGAPSRLPKQYGQSTQVVEQIDTRQGKSQC
jgi:hypothetical protein